MSEIKRTSPAADLRHAVVETHDLQSIGAEVALPDVGAPVLLEAD
jgi:hypothetical protein